MTEEQFILTQQNLCTSITAIERINGLLSTTPENQFSVNFFGTNFDITVFQHGIRETTIASDRPTEADHFWSLFLCIRRLDMLFDGRFLDLHSVQFYTGEEETSWSNELFVELQRRKLEFYSSADYSLGRLSFANPIQFLSADLLQRWMDIESDLDIVHKMVLYSVSSVGLPVDLKNAFLIESFESLFELLQKKDSTLQLEPKRQMTGGIDSKLRRILKTIILKYGDDIFAEEKSKNLDDFCQVLVNSRNRIAHIKTNCPKLYLGAKESILYSVKLSVLYRHILLQLLSVNYSEYNTRISKIVHEWNSWQGTLTFFLKTKWTE